MNSVEWKPIKGFEGIYEISNLGEVKSLPRFRPNGRKSGYLTKEKILKQAITTNGYLKVSLTKMETKKDFKVHRLVAIAFIPNPFNKPNVNHIDGNSRNNCANNLNWCTQKENAIHSSLFELRKRKINQSQTLELIKMYLARESVQSICSKFNICRGTLHTILRKNNIKKISNVERKIKFNLNKDYLISQLETKTQTELSEEIGCDPSLISHYLKRIKKQGGIYKC